jgi:transketolase
MTDPQKKLPLDIRDAFFDELYEIARRDRNVVFLTADMGALSLERFRQDFPDRFINVGVAEQNLVSVAAGLALAGKRVFIYAIIPFVTLRCLEQIKVDLCVMKLPVTIVGSGAGFTYSSDGPTHHAIEDVSIMRALPGMTIYNPSDQVTAKAAALSASQCTGPVYIRLDKGSLPALYQADEDLSNGLALLRNGTKLLIIATGCMTHVALHEAEALRKSGINPGVVDLFRLKPIGEELIEIAQGYERVVTLEEHTLPGGMGGAVVELFADKGLMVPVKRLGIPDVYPACYGDREQMRKETLIHNDYIKKEMATFCAAKGRNMSIQDFASSFGTTPEEIPEECKELICKYNFTYTLLEGEAKEPVVMEVLNKIDSDQQVIAAPKRESVWNKGWSENLKEFISQGGNIDTLVPKFLRPSKVFRLFGGYVSVSDPEFERNFIKVLRSWLFRTYFSPYDTIYEFGSGTGHNLVELAHLFPEKELIGLDFAPSSCELISRLGTDLNCQISSRLFNMIEPDKSYKLERDSLVFTFGAIEQLGASFNKFLEYVIDNHAALCVHIEPIIELYDEATLFDSLAIRFHKKRGYAVKFLPRLQEMENEDRIQLLKVKRSEFGSLMMEGYSLIIWKPLKDQCYGFGNQR